MVWRGIERRKSKISLKSKSSFGFQKLSLAPRQFRQVTHPNSKSARLDISSSFCYLTVMVVRAPSTGDYLRASLLLLFSVAFLPSVLHFRFFGLGSLLPSWRPLVAKCCGVVQLIGFPFGFASLGAPARRTMGSAGRLGADCFFSEGA